jgi:GntR family phosphonate transport system transcriptional regulator
MSANLDLSVDRSAGVPVGAQLASRIRSAVRDGSLEAGDRVPSVRELADSAGVNVNTARAVYARLESEGIVRSEQGRGTFVAAAPQLVDAATRRELHRQIAQLEAALVQLPPPPTLANQEASAELRPGAALLSTEDLHAVRDELIARLGELDAQRAAVLQRLHQLGVEETSGASARRATPSLARARIRWVGA